MILFVCVFSGGDNPLGDVSAGVGLPEVCSAKQGTGLGSFQPHLRHKLRWGVFRLERSALRLVLYTRRFRSPGFRALL